jgi:hypothetical protein
MPMTLYEIVEETREMPAEVVADWICRNCLHQSTS